MSPRAHPFACLLRLGAVLTPVAAVAATDLESRFTKQVHPFLETYCISCHGAEKPKADFDLSPYSTMNRVVADYANWELVLEKLESGEMPNEKAEKFPTDKLRHEIIDWIQAMRKAEGKKNAGDPGPVLARRLSNAEYDYTIRDLTGADIRPTREFPVDPANQAGFDNSGESLAMSPALVKKYLQAAREVSEHLLLQPEGFAFAPHPVVIDTDRDKYSVLKIVDFYRRQPTDYAAYFWAAWRYEYRAVFGEPNLTLAESAARAKLSPKYLATIWSTLAEKREEVGPIAKLQAMWRAVPVVKAMPGEVRQGFEQMRDFVIRVREEIVPEVKNLKAPQINEGSQTLVLWKDRQMAANRRRYDPAALQVASATPVADAAASAEKAMAAKPAAAPGPRPVDPIRAGGVFLAPEITTTASSATFQMAAAKRRAGDPDLVVPAEPAERARYEAAFARFAEIFPDAFYITERARVYLDAEKERKLEGRLLSAGLHSMTGFFRDDGPLYDLVLDDAGRKELDRLWQEFDFAAFIPERMHTSFVWFERTDSNFMRDSEFDPYRPEDKSVTSQPKIKKLAELYLTKAVKNGASEQVQAAIKEHFEIVAANVLRVEEQRVAAEPSHLAALQRFAERAYRRPLTTTERAGLLAFYRESRDANGLDHEEAMRDCVASVLMSPHFSYRIDLAEAAGASSATPVPAQKKPGFFASKRPPAEAAPALRPGTRPLSDYALANRLSYFIWASMPDAELLAHAASGDLHRPEVLAAQARRMTKDDRIRRLAVEFGGNWLDFRRFEEINTVDRERFPEFTNELRSAMFEEPVRFFTDLVRENRSVLNFLYADYTFVNAALAKHYGIANYHVGLDDWERIDHADRFGRGGLMPMAVFLTANSPGLRTSPVKRGYWVVRRLLGERIPPPPAVVPLLPNDEKQLGELTLRETLAKHREDKSCASCHARFDSFGLVFEGYGAVGERREKDFGGHAVDTRAAFADGKERTGLAGLRSFVQEKREADFVENLCRKLTAYALGRTLLPSDDALIEQMRARLAKDNFRFGGLVETIITSPQFLTKRVPATLAANSAPTPAQP
jgi:hypothetical protein